MTDGKQYSSGFLVVIFEFDVNKHGQPTRRAMIVLFRKHRNTNSKAKTTMKRSVTQLLEIKVTYNYRYRLKDLGKIEEYLGPVKRYFYDFSRMIECIQNIRHIYRCSLNIFIHFEKCTLMY